MALKHSNRKRYTYLLRCKWWHWQKNWLPEVNEIDRQCYRLEELSDISKVQGRSFPHSPGYLPSPGLQPGLTLEFEENQMLFDRWTPRRRPTKNRGQVSYLSIWIDSKSIFLYLPSFGIAPCVGTAGSGTWLLHLMQPCLLALGRVLIWVGRRTNLEKYYVKYS